MNKTERRGSAPVIGGSSLLVIFAVLCLTVNSAPSAVRRRRMAVAGPAPSAERYVRVNSAPLAERKSRMAIPAPAGTSRMPPSNSAPSAERKRNK